MDIDTTVHNYFHNIGWVGTFDLVHCAYYELVLKFYVAFRFQRHAQFSLDTPGIISFRLLGTTHSLSLIDFNIALNFMTDDYVLSTKYENNLCTFSVDFKAIDAFVLLIENVETTYNAKILKDLWFHNPALCYVHRYLVYNYSGRRDASTTVSKTKLFLLWCMYSDRLVNLCYWYELQFEHVINAK